MVESRELVEPDSAAARFRAQLLETAALLEQARTRHRYVTRIHVYDSVDANMKLIVYFLYNCFTSVNKSCSCNRVILHVHL